MAGVPLGAELRADGASYTLRDLLERSRREARPDQELPWTVSAYSYYLAADARWVNKFGQHMAYSDLLAGVLDQESEPCGGAHRLFALARALRVHASTDDLRLQALLRRVSGELDRSARELKGSVDSEGRVTLAAFEEMPRTITGRRAEDARIVFANGHSLEWLATARAFVGFDRDCLERLVTCLADACERQCRRLDRPGQPFEDDEAWEFGNLCHAGSGLALFAAADSPSDR
jgi:hypothetical protein